MNRPFRIGKPPRSRMSLSSRKLAQAPEPAKLSELIRSTLPGRLLHISSEHLTIEKFQTSEADTKFVILIVLMRNKNDRFMWLREFCRCILYTALMNDKVDLIQSGAPCFRALESALTEALDDEEGFKLEEWMEEVHQGDLVRICDNIVVAGDDIEKAYKLPLTPGGSVEPRQSTVMDAVAAFYITNRGYLSQAHCHRPVSHDCHNAAVLSLARALYEILNHKLDHMVFDEFTDILPASWEMTL